MIRVLLIDGHQLFHAGVKAVLLPEKTIEFIGSITCLSQEWDLIKDTSPNVILFTPITLGLNWAECIEKLSDYFPNTNLIAILQSIDEAKDSQVLYQNVAGFIVKEESPQKLCEAIIAVYNGQKWISSSLIPYLFNPTIAEIKLTPRENELLQLLVQGKADKEMAAIMHISERTVRTHLKGIRRKLDVTSRVEMAVHAVRLGLVPDNISHNP